MQLLTPHDRHASLTPTEQLEPFRLFCAEGKRVQSLLRLSGPVAAERRQIQQACQQVFAGLVRVLNASELRNGGDKSQEPLPSNLLELLGSLVGEDAEKPLILAERVAIAYIKVPKTFDGNVDWRNSSDEAELLEMASVVFQRRLVTNPEMLKAVLTKLKTYEDQISENTLSDHDELEDTWTKVPFFWTQSATNAKQLADSTYEALNAMARVSCGCEIVPKPHDFETRLPLLAYRLPGRMLRMQMRRLQSDWQHAVISLPPASDSTAVDHDTGLCAQLIIASLNLQSLNFALEGSSLRVRPLTPHLHPRWAPEFATNARSLESLVADLPRRCGKKMILVIAFKLAWAAVYLCGGPWLKKNWNDTNVCFMERGESWIPPHPYLGTNLPSRADEHRCTHLCFGCVNQQKSPYSLQLTSLGLMLMELRSGTTARQFAEERGMRKENISAVADHFFQTFRRDMIWDQDYDYLHAVRACLDKNFGVENGRLCHPEDLRGQVLQRIVAPLYKALYHFCSSAEDLDSALLDENVTVTDVEKHVGPETRYPTAVNAGETFLKRTGGESASWFSRLDTVLAAMEVPKESPSSHSRVKIAILDTGIDPKNTNVERVQYKDFVEPEGCYADETGHGTNSANLMLRIYPEAELFIARIFKTDHANDTDDPTRMAEAIKWAASNDVDIISISAGFRNKKAEVFRAIQTQQSLYLLKQKALFIFAAVSNFANQYDGVAYPARHHEEVFSIYSCSSNSKQTDKTNPDPDQFDNFAMLGEDVRVFPRQVLDGSSISTVLAAGFAARIIDFTRHPDVDAHLKDKGLRSTQALSREDMKLILRNSSIRTGRFHCITPDKIWNLANGQPPQRKLIIKVIRRSLKRQPC